MPPALPLLLLIALLTVGCGTSDTSSGADAGAQSADDDANAPSDTGADTDTAQADAKPPEDTSTADDTAAPDAPTDTSPTDTSPTDTSPSDTATPEDTGGPTPRTPKSLYIALDGVRPDALATARTPNLDRLIAGTWQPGYQGAYTPFAQNLTDAATVSGPNHATIMTGALGAQHGVTGNGDVDSVDVATYPHLLTLLERHKPSLGTVCLFTWTPDGLITSEADYIVDGDDDGNVTRLVNILQGVHEDPAGFYNTAWAAGQEVDAAFLFLDNPDAAGHGNGFEPGVAAYVAELEATDARIGSLLNAIAARPTFDAESWQIVVTSDHGGYGTGHGGGSAAEHTIPFLVAGRDVTQGLLPDPTRIEDGVPTVLTHMGAPVPDHLTGTPRGDTVTPPPTSPLGQDLVAYYRFEGSLDDASGQGHHAAVGPGSASPPDFSDRDGRFGQHVAVRPPGAGASYLTLGTLDAFALGDDGALTVTLWFRATTDQSGDPVILGNKDWSSGGNPGFLLLADEGGDNSFGSNYASRGADRIDLEDINYPTHQWWFLAATFNPDGLAVLYAGDPEGRLRAIALDASQVGPLDSPLPVNIGQDGTGAYPHHLEADIDDLAVWRRALHPEEVRSLYGMGDGQELLGLLGE